MVVEYQSASRIIVDLISEPEFEIDVDESGLGIRMDSRRCYYPWPAIEHLYKREDSVMVIITGFHVVLVHQREFESNDAMDDWIKLISEKSGIEIA